MEILEKNLLRIWIYFAIDLIFQRMKILLFWTFKFFLFNQGVETENLKGNLLRNKIFRNSSTLYGCIFKVSIPCKFPI